MLPFTAVTTARRSEVSSPVEGGQVPGLQTGLSRATIWLRRGPITDRVALSALLVITVVSVAAPLLAPAGSTERVDAPFLPPSLTGPLLGTDELGRDLLIRVLYGLRSTWLSALVVVAVATFVGGLIGLVAGAAGGWIDNLLMRVTDLFLALPGPVLAIAVVAALGPSLRHVLIAVSLVWWPLYARVMRGEVRALSARPHVEAARVAGVAPRRRALRHLLPGAVPPLIVAATLDVGLLVVTLAGLSFIGLGSPAPSPELGAMTARGFTYLLEHWWIPVVPGLAVGVLALVANLAGDSIRDRLGEST